jgi:hypothetical protein
MPKLTSKKLHQSGVRKHPKTIHLKGNRKGKLKSKKSVGGRFPKYLK